METHPVEILTVDETAELLRIPRSSVYKLAQEGKIPAQKVGRHWRFHRETLLNWVAGIVPDIQSNPLSNPSSIDE